MKKALLTPIERALLLLAKHIDQCPYNQYKVEEQIADELGYEKIKPAPTRSKRIIKTRSGHNL